MSSRLLAQACTAINNANRRNKRQVLIRTINHTVIQFFKMMQHYQYIDELTVINDRKTRKMVVSLNGKLNKCAAISPNYDLQLGDIEKFKVGVLPARQFGHLILHTSKGMMEHSDAVGNVGGKVVGYFY